MKRRKLVDYIISQGCIKLREGAKHSVFYNPVTNRTSTVPRHYEINNCEE